MEKYTNKYEVALAIAEKFGSTNDHLSNIFEALIEIAQLKGISVEGYSNKYDVLRALALNEGVSGSLSNSYECLVGLAGIYGGTNFSNNYEAALYLLDNAETGFGGMTFTAVTAGAIGMSHHGTNATTTIPRLQYSRDGETWTNWMFETLFANAGDKIYFKGINDKISHSNENYSNFSLTGSFKASGNIMSLLYGDDYKDKESLTGKDYCFYGLFYGTKGILTSPKLPATTLAIYCYAYMFDGTNIEKMPELPATSLVYRCYYGMFANCKSLTETTLLPAERLIGDCYRGMFNGATSLHTVRANFITTPSDDYTEDWLNNVAAEGTFYVSKDAAWIDEITRGANTIPVNWEIKGRQPNPYVYVTIDGNSVKLRGDMTFAEQGYNELYSQAEYYPRFGQHYYDFTFNVNSYPMSGLEVFTTCTTGVHMVSITVDGAAYQVNYYTSWFANGFTELYTQKRYESAEEVEEIDVDTTYPNEGDSFYTSYIITLLPEGYTPVDYIYNTTNTPLNTGYSFVSDYTIELEVKCPTNITGSGQYKVIAGCVGSSGNSLSIPFSIGSNRAAAFGTARTNINFSGGYAAWNNTRVKYVVSRNGIDVSKDNTNLHYNWDITIPDFTTSSGIRIFGASSSGGAAADAVGLKVYNAKIIKGDTLRGNYIPAIKDETGQAGFYNAVSGTFLTGTQCAAGYDADDVMVLNLEDE